LTYEATRTKKAISYVREPVVCIETDYCLRHTITNGAHVEGQ